MWIPEQIVSIHPSFLDQLTGAGDVAEQKDKWCAKILLSFAKWWNDLADPEQGQSSIDKSL